MCLDGGAACAPGERSCMLTVAESSLIVAHREILRAVPKAPRRKGVELPLYCGRSIPCNPVTKRTELPMSMARDGVGYTITPIGRASTVDPAAKVKAYCPKAETRTLRREALDALFEPAGTNPGAPSNSPREFLRARQEAALDGVMPAPWPPSACDPPPLAHAGGGATERVEPLAECVPPHFAFSRHPSDLMPPASAGCRHANSSAGALMAMHAGRTMPTTPSHVCAYSKAALRDVIRILGTEAVH